MAELNAPDLQTVEAPTERQPHDMPNGEKPSVPMYAITKEDSLLTLELPQQAVAGTSGCLSTCLCFAICVPSFFSCLKPCMHHNCAARVPLVKKLTITQTAYHCIFNKTKYLSFGEMHHFGNHVTPVNSSSGDKIAVEGIRGVRTPSFKARVIKSYIITFCGWELTTYTVKLGYLHFCCTRNKKEAVWLAYEINDFLGVTEQEYLEDETTKVDINCCFPVLEKIVGA